MDEALNNHYYLFRALEEQGDGYTADIHFLPGGDVGALVNVAGAGVVDTSENREAAEAFVRFLLSEEAQQYFRDETFEYPLVEGVEANPRLPALAQIQSPDIDLSSLADLEGTLQLMQETGVLE